MLFSQRRKNEHQSQDRHSEPRPLITVKTGRRKSHVVSRMAIAIFFLFPLLLFLLQAFVWDNKETTSDWKVDEAPADWKAHQAVDDIHSNPTSPSAPTTSSAVTQNHNTSRRQESSVKRPYIIPHILIMTHQTNLLDPRQQTTVNVSVAKTFLPNIHRTFKMYQRAWAADKSSGSSNDETKIWFLDDNDCKTILHRIHPDLAYYFHQEKTGMFKADLCRAAALYFTGGYYIDLDLFPLSPAQHLVLPNDVEFCTVIMLEGPAAGLAYFQAFWAAAPNNPIVKHSLFILLCMYYQQDGRTNDIEALKHSNQTNDDGTAIDTALDLLQEFKGTLLGPIATKAAYDTHVNSVPAEQQVNALFLAEELMRDETRRQMLRDDKHFYYQDHSNHEYGPGQGCCCDYLVHNGTQAMFFSRFVGSGWRCQRKEHAATSDSSAFNEHDLSFWQRKNQQLPLFSMKRDLHPAA